MRIACQMHSTVGIALDWNHDDGDRAMIMIELTC